MNYVATKVKGQHRLFMTKQFSFTGGGYLAVTLVRYITVDTEEYFIGGGLLSRISGHFFFNPNAEYIFVDNFTYMTFNLDFHYDFYTQSALFFWLGSG